MVAVIDGDCCALHELVTFENLWSVMETSVQIIIVEFLDSLFKANFQRRHFTFGPNTEFRTIF